MSELKDFIEAIGEGLRQIGNFLEGQLKGQRPALQPIPVRSRPSQAPQDYPD